GRRGALSVRLTVGGIQARIACPDLGRNPIRPLAPALAGLTARQWDAGNEHFQPTPWQVSNVHGGAGALNVIPGSLQHDFNFRFSTASTERSLKERLEAVLKKHGVRYAIEWTLGAKPFIPSTGRLLA